MAQRLLAVIAAGSALGGVAVFAASRSGFVGLPAVEEAPEWAVHFHKKHHRCADHMVVYSIEIPLKRILHIPDPGELSKKKVLIEAQLSRDFTSGIFLNFLKMAEIQVLQSSQNGEEKLSVKRNTTSDAEYLASRESFYEAVRHMPHDVGEEICSYRIAERSASEYLISRQVDNTTFLTWAAVKVHCEDERDPVAKYYLGSAFTNQGWRAKSLTLMLPFFWLHTRLLFTCAVREAVRISAA